MKSNKFKLKKKKRKSGASLVIQIVKKKKWSQIIPGSEIGLFFFWQNVDLFVSLFKAASSEFVFFFFQVLCKPHK